MRKSNFALSILFAFLILSSMAFIPTHDVHAGTKEVKFVIPAGRYPEAAELMGLNMYLDALKGRMETHPDLQRIMTFKIMDKGMMFGSQEECLNGVATGAAEMTYAQPHFLEQYDPAWKLGMAPGIFDSFEHFQRTMETPAWKALQKDMAKRTGVTVTKWMFHVGDWYLFTSKGPVKTMADIKGQKIRIAGGEGFAKAIAGLGASSVSLPYTEVVTALQTNMINGLLTDMGGAFWFDLPRYTKYLVPVSWAISPACWVVNTNWYESLDPKAKSAIDDVFERIDVSDFYENYNANLVEKWKSGPDTELNELDKSEIIKWKNAMKSATRDLYNDIDPKYIEAIESTR
jgi:TRAP-type C4-dicarboxylate transport system substrate-binding protein